jgi:hypothetical protein
MDCYNWYMLQFPQTFSDQNWFTKSFPSFTPPDHRAGYEVNILLTNCPVIIFHLDSTNVEIVGLWKLWILIHTVELLTAGEYYVEFIHKENIKSCTYVEHIALK